MNAVRTVRFAALALILSVAGALSAAPPARAADGDTYAAVVFSPNGKYGYACKASTKEQAENDAKEQCQATGDLVAVWAKNGYVALAVGAKGTVDADAGAMREEAERKVRQRVRDAGDSNPIIVICVNSDGD